MREVLTAFVTPKFCALIADDTGLIFKKKVNGEWHPAAMLRYDRIDSADFYGSNVVLAMKSGAVHKAAVLQKKRLLEILGEKGIFCCDHGFSPFYKGM